MNMHTKPFYVHKAQCMQMSNLSNPGITGPLIKVVQTSVTVFTKIHETVLLILENYFSETLNYLFLKQPV